MAAGGVPALPLSSILPREKHTHVHTHSHLISAHSLTHTYIPTHKQNLNEIPIILGWALWLWLHSEPCVTNTKSLPSGGTTRYSWCYKQTFVACGYCLLSPTVPYVASYVMLYLSLVCLYIFIFFIWKKIPFWISCRSQDWMKRIFSQLINTLSEHQRSRLEVKWTTETDKCELYES